MTTEQGPPPEMKIQRQLDQPKEKKNTEFHYKIKGRKKEAEIVLQS